VIVIVTPLTVEADDEEDAVLPLLLVDGLEAELLSEPRVVWGEPPVLVGL
jgi:hypothetical protein